MHWTDILIKIIQIIGALISIWNSKGTKQVLKSIPSYIDKKHKDVCDKACELKKIKQNEKTPV